MDPLLVAVSFGPFAILVSGVRGTIMASRSGTARSARFFTWAGAAMLTMVCSRLLLAYDPAFNYPSAEIMYIVLSELNNVCFILFASALPGAPRWLTLAPFWALPVLGGTLGLALVAPDIVGRWPTVIASLMVGTCLTIGTHFASTKSGLGRKLTYLCSLLVGFWTLTQVLYLPILEGYAPGRTARLTVSLMAMFALASAMWRLSGLPPDTEEEVRRLARTARITFRTLAVLFGYRSPYARDMIGGFQIELPDIEARGDVKELFQWYQEAIVDVLKLTCLLALIKPQEALSALITWLVEIWRNKR